MPRYMSYATLIALARTRFEIEVLRARITGVSWPTLASVITTCRDEAVAAGFTVENAP